MKTTGNKQEVFFFSVQKQLDNNNRLWGSYWGSLSSYLHYMKRNNKVKLQLSLNSVTLTIVMQLFVAALKRMREGRTDLLHSVSAGNHPLVHHVVLKEPPAVQKKKRKRLKSISILVWKCQDISEELSPHTQQNKTPLIPTNPSKTAILPDRMLYSVNTINKTCRK